MTCPDDHSASRRLDVLEREAPHLVAAAGPDRIRNCVTLNCVGGDHDRCGGYIAPLVYSNTRPCECRCHDARERLPLLNGETISDYNARLALARGEA